MHFNISRTASLKLSGFALLAIIAQQSHAQLTALPPGSTNQPVPLNNGLPFGATFEESLASAFSETTGAGTISGTLFSAVFRTGGNTLDFYYQVALDAGSVESIGFSVSSFSGIDLSSPGFGVAQTANDLTLPMSEDPSGNFFLPGLTAINFAQRSLGDGDAIFADFNGFLTAGNRSNIFIARTNFNAFSLAGNATINGAAVSANTVNVALAPLPAGTSNVAPEPGSALLALCGASVALGMVVRRRRASL